MITCIPIVTVFPATIAMFSVVRKWQLENDSSVLRLYVKEFKSNFKDGFFIWIVCLVTITVLFFDLLFIMKIQSNFKIIGIGIFIAVSIFLISTMLFLFPILSKYKVNWTEAILNSFILSMIKFPTTILLFLVKLSLLVIVYFFPPMITISFSLYAYINYKLCHKKFKEIIQTNNFTN